MKIYTILTTLIAALCFLIGFGLARYFKIKEYEFKNRPYREFIIFGQDTVLIDGYFKSDYSRINFSNGKYREGHFPGDGVTSYTRIGVKKQDKYAGWDIVATDSYGHIDTVYGFYDKDSMYVIPQIDTTVYKIMGRIYKRSK